MENDRQEPLADGFSLAAGFAVAALLAQMSIAGWMFYEIWRQP